MRTVIILGETQGQKHSLTTEILMDFGQSVSETGKFAGEVTKLGASFNVLSDAVHKVANDSERMNLAIGDKIARAVAEIKDGSNIKLNANSIKSAVESAIASKLIHGKVNIEGDLSPLSVNLTQKKWSSMTSEVRTKMKEAIEASSIKVGNVKPFVFSEYGFRELQERFNKELQSAISTRMSFAWGSVTKEMKDGTMARVPKPMKFEVKEEDLKHLMNTVSNEFMKHISDPKNIVVGNIQPVQFDSARLNMAVGRIKEAIGDIDKHLLNVNMDELKKLPNLDKSMMNFRTAMETTVAQITQLDAELKGLRLNGQEKELASVLNKIQGLRTTIVDKVGLLITSVGEEIKQVPLGTKEYANYKATLDNVGLIVDRHIQAEINGMVTGLAARLGIDPATGASTKGVGENNKWIASIKGVQELLIASAESAVKNLAHADLGIDFNLIINHFREWSSQMRAKMLLDSQHSLEKLTAQLTASNKEVLDSFAQAITRVAKFQFEPTAVGNVMVNLPVDQLRPRVLAEIEKVVKEMVQGFRAVPHGAAGTVDTVTLPESTTSSINTALKGILMAQSEQLLAQLRAGEGVKPSASDLAQLDAVMAQESKELIKLIVDQASKNARTLAEGISANGFRSFTKDDQARIKQEMEMTLRKTVTEFTKAVDSAFGAFTMTVATAQSMHSKLSEKLNRKIATSDITFLDAKEPLVLTGAVTAIQKKLQEAVLSNIAAWKLDSIPLHIATDAPATAMRNAIQSMLNMASSKVVEGAGGIADGANAIFLNPKKLHKDVRRALATAEGFDKVADWEKAFKAGVSLEKATGQIMEEGVRTVLNKFHNAIAKNTSSAISAYSEALGKVDVQPDLTSVHVLVRRVGEMMDNVQFRMVEVLTKNLESFYKGAIDGIKNLPHITPSIGYRPPAGGSLESTPQPFPFGELRANLPVDTRYPTADKPPKGYSEFDMMNRWEREARIRVLNTRNRFEKSNLSEDQRSRLHDFLDNDYMGRVQEAVSRFQQGHRVGDMSPYQTLRESILDASLSLRYMVEQFRKINLGATTKSNVAEMKNKLTEYQGSSAIKMESLRTKFIGKLNSEQMGDLEDHLSSLKRRVDSLANADIINEEDITKAQKGMRQLNREIDLVAKGYDRILKVSGIEREIDKLSEKMNRLMAGSLLPVNKMARLGDLINDSYADHSKFKDAKEYYADLVQESRQLNANQRHEKSLQVSKNALNRDLETLRMDSLVDEGQLSRLAELIDRAIDPQDIAEARAFKSELMAINRELKKQEEIRRKRGEKIAESPMLKGDKAVFTEQLNSVLKTVDALKGYEITQMNVNNATNTWTVKLRDAEGNLRTLTGSIDKATGELFKHSEALQMVTQNAMRASSSIGSTIGRTGDILGNYMSNPVQDKRQNGGGIRGGFGTSVVNTMRYITAGALMGYPTMLLHESFQSAKEFDYQLAKARQNFEVKYLEPVGGNYEITDSKGEKVTAPRVLPNMSRLGEVLVDGAMKELEDRNGGKLTKQKRDDEVALATTEVKEYMKTGVVKDLQMIALLNGLDQQEVGLAYHIASRRYDNPYEATAFAREVAKVRSIEEVDIEKTATGFEAISSQWGINGYALQKVSNMMIMAANISQAKIEDLIATQQKAGSLFRNAMGNRSKEDALAHSIAFSSMFVQATARSGTEGGTFWKAIIEKPYTKQGRDELVKMASMNPELFGDLNPYNKDGSARDFVDIFGSILETSMKMTDKDRIEMWKPLFPQWHTGSAAAVSAFTQDLQHTMEKVMHVTKDDKFDANKDGELSIKESINAYVESIKNADEDTSTYIRAGMMDTWKFRQSQVKTAWQISTYDAWEELKGEFSNLATYLTSFLRIIGENAGGIVDTMGLIARIMAGVGVKIAWGKFSDAVDNADKKKHAKKIEGYGNAINENARMENLRRIGIQEEIAHHQNRANARNSYRAEVNTKIVGKEGEIHGLKAKRDEHQSLYEKAIKKGDTTAASFHSVERDHAESTAKAKGKEIEQLRKELQQLDQQDGKTRRSLEALDAELGDNGRAMAQLQNRARALTLAMDDMGIDSTQLKSNLNFLNREFQTGTIDASRYDAEIKKIGKEAGMSDGDISKLKREVDKLNKSFKEGAMDATKYVSKMKELERAHLTGSLGVPGGGVANVGSAGHSGVGLMDMAMMGLLAKDLIGGGKRGVFGKVKDVFQTKSLGSLFSKNTPMRGVNGEILRDLDGKVIKERAVNAERAARAGAAGAGEAGAAARAGKGLLGGITKAGKTVGKFGKLLRPLKAIPYLGTALAGADALMALIDPLTAMGMTDHEKKAIRSENKKELAKDFKDWEESSGLGAWWKGANLAWDGVFSGIGAALGGNNSSWSDYWKGFKAVGDGDGKYVEETLKKEYNYEQEALDAKVEAQMEINKKLEEQNKYHPLDTNKDGLLDPATDGANQTITYESLDALLQKINGELAKSVGNNETDYQVTRSRLLISGVREDSKQMRDLMENYLRENIKFFDKAINKLQETYDMMADGVEKDKVGAELNDKKQQKAQSELQLTGVKNSKIDELQRRMTDQLDLTQMGYDKRMYELLASNGGKEDAPEVVKLNKERISAVNEKLAGFQGEWDVLLKTGGFKPNSDEYMTIWKNLQSIGVEQAKNLAEMNKKMSKQQSTFNVPSGLKVMDYYDYMTKNNTHKSTIVGAGNVTVNVNIDNMTGDTKDVEKMTSALENTLKKNNSNQYLVNQFAGNVKANMGSNYKGIKGG